MCGVHIRVEEDNGNGLHAEFNELLGDSARSVLIECFNNVAFVIEALGQFQDVLAFHQALWLAVLPVIHRNAIGATEQVHVTETFRGDDAGLSSATRQERVQAERGAVDEVRDRFQTHTRCSETIEYTLLWITWCGGHLVELHIATATIKCDDVGKRASDVNCYTGAFRHELSPFPKRCRPSRRTSAGM